MILMLYMKNRIYNRNVKLKADKTRFEKAGKVEN